MNTYYVEFKSGKNDKPTVEVEACDWTVMGPLLVFFKDFECTIKGPAYSADHVWCVTPKAVKAVKAVKAALSVGSRVQNDFGAVGSVVLLDDETVNVEFNGSGHSVITFSCPRSNLELEPGGDVWVPIDEGLWDDDAFPRVLRIGSKVLKGADPGKVVAFDYNGNMGGYYAVIEFASGGKLKFGVDVLEYSPASGFWMEKETAAGYGERWHSV